MIISADDFGVSKSANKNILELARRGKLDRVSVMASQDYLGGEDVSELKKTGVKLDIHLELPRAKGKKHKLKDGVARRGLIFLLHYILGRNGKKNMKQAWAYQIERFRDIFGRYPDGINSHEYIHFFPPYFKTALELARDNKINFIRFGKEGPLRKKSNVSRVLGRLHRVNNKRFVCSGLQSSDCFVSLDWIRDRKKFLDNLPEGKTELICHPERGEEFDIINKWE